MLPRLLARSMVAALALGGCDGELLPAERFVPDCATGGCPCSIDAHCRDQQACTVDRCVGGGCAFVAGQDGVGCDDGDGCTVKDACASGACKGSPRDCDDGNACTAGDRCEAGDCVAGTSRPLWHLTIPLQGDDHPYGVAQAPDAGAYVAGFNVPKPQEFRARVLRMAATGSVVWDKVYPSGVSAQIYGATADGNGGVLVAGIWWVAAATQTLENWHPFVMRLDAKGSELWKQIDAKGGKIEPITVLDNGDVLALGYQNFLAPSLPMAWRLERDSGNEVERVLLGGSKGRLYGVARLPSAAIIGCGRLGDEGTASQSLLLHYDKGVLTHVADGGIAEADDAIRACAPTPTGGVFGVGASVTALLSAPLLARWDGEGPLEIGTVQPPAKDNDAWLEAIAALPEGGFVGGGAARVNGIDVGWWLVGLDAAGKRTWSREGPSSLAGTADVIRDCATMTDGTVVCVGEQSEATKGSHDTVVVRVDSAGRTSCE